MITWLIGIAVLVVIWGMLWQRNYVFAFGILLGLPLASMSGNDPETQLSIAKGQLNAVRLAMADKGCR